MLRLLFVCLLTTASLRAWAEELAIIDIRRNITLSDNDPIYKDFYINAGDNSGLKKNLVVTAVRKISIRDASGSQAYGEILVPVGQLRIIAVFNRIAVAREYKLLSRDDLPMLEQIGIMTGDRVDLQGAFIDSAKPESKNVSAAEAPAAPLKVVLGVSSTGPSPASVAPAAAVATIASPVSAPSSPPPAEKVTEPSQTPQKLEKTADSGNNSDL